jgi:hypothetical protein
VLAVLSVTGNLDGNDVFDHVLPAVCAELGARDPRADKGAPCLVLTPARQLSLGALVLRGLLGRDVDDDDVQLAH